MKKSLIRCFFCLFCFVFCTLQSFQKSALSNQENLLTEQVVINSAVKHYPKIYVSEQKLRVAEAKMMEAKGEFDTKLDVKQRKFLSGYYDDVGYIESRVVKPLPVFNSRVYSGYSLSQNGAYPEINNYYNTKDEGRAMFGFELSILRGFLTNEQNAINKIAGLDVKIANYNNKLMLAQVKADSAKAYWRYFYTKKIFDIYKNNLEVAIKRQSAFEIQVKRGDKAKIILDENKRVILRRQSLLENINREMLNSALNLSMYLRDDDGNVKNVDWILNYKLPEAESATQVINNLEDVLKLATQSRLDVKIANILLNQGRITLKLAKNNILPTLDVAFEVSKDFGEGDIRKDETAQKVALNLSIPIENNKQRSKYNKAKHDINMVEAELRLLKDSILNEIKSIFNRVNEVKNIIKNAEEEITLTKRLLEVENIRFKSGDSDFFMINAREQDLLSITEYKERNKLALAEIITEYNFATKDSIETE